MLALCNFGIESKADSVRVDSLFTCILAIYPLFQIWSVLCRASHRWTRPIDIAALHSIAWPHRMPDGHRRFRRERYLQRTDVRHVRIALGAGYGKAFQLVIKSSEHVVLVLFIPSGHGQFSFSVTLKIDLMHSFWWHYYSGYDLIIT